MFSNAYLFGDVQSSKKSLLSHIQSFVASYCVTDIFVIS